MRLPFTTEQFFDAFRIYNELVWPAQLVLMVLAFLIVLAALRPTPARSRAIVAALAVLWLWMAVAYHISVFRAVNPAAVLFGALFLVQAALFVWIATRRSAPALQVRGLGGADAHTVVGGLLVLYALVVYPAIGYALGHRYPAAPTFGVPCPTTIFTFGVLLWSSSMPRVVLVIPTIWALIATQAIVQLGVREDIGLTVAAVVVVALSSSSVRRQQARSRAHAAGVPSPDLLGR